MEGHMDAWTTHTHNVSSNVLTVAETLKCKQKQFGINTILGSENNSLVLTLIKQ